MPEFARSRLGNGARLHLWKGQQTGENIDGRPKQQLGTSEVYSGSTVCQQNIFGKCCYTRSKTHVQCLIRPAGLFPISATGAFVWIDVEAKRNGRWQGVATDNVR